MGVLALTNEHLYYMHTPESDWQHRLLKDICSGSACDSCPVSAMWCPDSTTVLLVTHSGIILWNSTDETVQISLRFIGLHRTVGCAHACILKCSPDGRHLALLGMEVFLLASLKTGAVLLMQDYSAQQRPQDLVWTAAGDKVMLSRGNCWHLLCFGYGAVHNSNSWRKQSSRQGRLLQGNRIAEVLANAVEAAGRELDDPCAVGRLCSLRVQAVGCWDPNAWHDSNPPTESDSESDSESESESESQ